MLRKLPSALGVGVLLMKSLRVALPPSTAWFVGMPLLDTTRFSFTTQRNKFQLNLEKQRRCRCFFCFELFIKHQKICRFRCVDNIIEYATMGLWRASVSCLFCISNLAKYHIHVKVGRPVNLQKFLKGAMLLTLVMVVGLLPTSVYAADADGGSNSVVIESVSDPVEVSSEK